MARSGRVVATVALSTTVLGLAISLLVAPPPGADHSCPAGAGADACRYPGSQTSWTVWWTVGGLVLGLLVSLSLVAIRDHRRFVDLED